MLMFLAEVYKATYLPTYPYACMFMPCQRSFWPCSTSHLHLLDSAPEVSSESFEPWVELVEPASWPQEPEPVVLTSCRPDKYSCHVLWLGHIVVTLL